VIGVIMSGEENRSEHPVEFSWSEWPAREKPHLAVVGVLFVVGVSLYVYFTFASIAYTAISAFVLLVSFRSVLLPSTYTIDSDGIEKSSFLSSRRKSWSELACFVRDDELVGVSTASEATHDSLSRGFVIRQRKHADEIVRCLRHYLPECRVDDGG
jgi:hypothetical protein